MGLHLKRLSPASRDSGDRGDLTRRNLYPPPVAIPRVPSASWSWTTRGLFLSLSVIWGFNFLFIRVGLGSASPLWLALLRAAVGTAATVVLVTPLRAWGKLDARGRRDALLLGLPNTTVFYALLMLSIESVLPGLAATVIYTFPLWVAVLSPSLLRHRLTYRHWAAVVAGFLGVALVSEVWSSLDLTQSLLAIVELLVAAFAWALGTVFFQRRFGRDQMREANAFQLLGGTAGLVVLVLIFAPSGFPVARPALEISLLWLGVLGTAIAYVIWFDLLGRTRAATLSAYVFLVPVVALIGSALFFGERLDAVQFLGVGLVFVSIYGIARAPGADELVTEVEPSLPD
jgi:O-acetylserine/cysteine efflux transporter